MKKKKKNLAWVLLFPLLIVVVMQGLLPFSTLLLSGVREVMEKNEVDLDSHMVENRRMVLENAMVDQWSLIEKDLISWSSF